MSHGENRVRKLTGQKKKLYHARFTSWLSKMMLVVESAKFTREKEILRGSLPIALLQGINGDTPLSGTDIQYHVQGGVDRLSRLTVTLVLSGEIELLCQRCLTPMSFTVSVNTTLTLFASEQAIDTAQQDDPDIDGIVLTDTLDIIELIREELILTLPYAPRHSGCNTDTLAKADKPNPFAVLADLGFRSQVPGGRKTKNLKD